MVVILWGALILITLFFTVSWLFFLAVYHFFEQRIANMLSEVEQNLVAQIDQVPVLIALMKPHVIKSGQVFERIIALRHRLQQSGRYSMSNLKSFHGQINFLLTIAEKHKQITNVKVYSIIKNDLNKSNLGLARRKEKLHEMIERYRFYRKLSAYVYFPGLWFIPGPKEFR